MHAMTMPSCGAVYRYEGEWVIQLVQIFFYIDGPRKQIFLKQTIDFPGILLVSFRSIEDDILAFLYPTPVLSEGCLPPLFS